METRRFAHPARQIVFQEYVDAIKEAQARVKGPDRRCAQASQLMAFVGLVPGEHSSGTRRQRGAMTKAGNAHVRRVLVEAARCDRFPARKTAALQRRA